MVPETSADLHRTTKRHVGICEKGQCHAVASEKKNKFADRLGFAHLDSVSDNFRELSHQFALLADQQLGRTDHVYEKDMSQAKIIARFRHKALEVLTRKYPTFGAERLTLKLIAKREFKSNMHCQGEIRTPDQPRTLSGLL
jgi:hypothetical protein